ncbi:MAG: hypothetical protein NZ822_00090 [Patescibacteria group bacterium]|nr:hypothetical protein [Patescibacteria group bacterium]
MKLRYYWLYFILPFFIWLIIYQLGLDFVVVFKRPLGENSLILPIEDLWQIILIFAIFQLGNEVLARFFQNMNIFVKINLIFIFLHTLVASYILIFNYLK